MGIDADRVPGLQGSHDDTRAFPLCDGVISLEGFKGCAPSGNTSIGRRWRDENSNILANDADLLACLAYLLVIHNSSGQTLLCEEFVQLGVGDTFC